MVSILECRIVFQVMTCGKLQHLVLIIADIVTFVVSEAGRVVATPNPIHGSEFTGTILVVTVVSDVQQNITYIIQFVLVVLYAEQLILNTELRSQVVLFLLPPCLHCTSNRVAIREHVTKVV